MFIVGRANEMTAGCLEHAKGWYEAAARRGHVESIHALARIAAAAGEYDGCRAWLSRLSALRSDSAPIASGAVGAAATGAAAGGSALTLVSVAPEVFSRHGTTEPGFWDGDPDFLVVSPEPDRAAAVLHRCTDRLMLVAEDGTELTEDGTGLMEDGTERAKSAFGLPVLYTPNYAWPVHRSAGGPVLLMDTKGFLPVPMGQTMLRVLIEELTSAGIAAHITASPPDAGEGEEWDLTKH